jgi:hypothetical protein
VVRRGGGGGGRGGGTEAKVFGIRTNNHNFSA